MKCTFCGYVFDPACALVTCQGCFLKKGCDLIQCPNCRFELVAEPRKESTSEKTKEMIEAGIAGEAAITQLDVNKDTVVTRLNAPDRGAMRKLIAMGVLPGTKIRLIQKFPSYVFQCGYDRFTLDEELAALILVRAV